ncbi:hypothetical protein SDC9_132200 [bioreactor metagenome]|uniref:Uncharacterized protein n=1 Tax=bioreactor metagenome TaxID=1076179 RepID=A0A645D851_9ZZZZ
MAEAVFTDAQQVQAHALNNLAQRLAALAVQFRVNIVEGVEQERQGDNVQSLVKRGIDQVGVGGQLGGSVDSGLNALGLIARGQLVGGVNLHGDGAARGVGHHLAEVAAHIRPNGVFRGGAGKLPCLLFKGGVAASGRAGSGAGRGGLVAAAASQQRRGHGQGHGQCKKLFHNVPPQILMTGQVAYLKSLP